MSIDRLQEKIRKTKNPTVLDFDIGEKQLPEQLLAQEGSFLKAYTRFCMELMDVFRGMIPAVKFNFAAFALLGSDGTACLSKLLDYGRQLGFYVILEVPEALSAQRANSNAELLFCEQSQWTCDGILISAYIGSDAVKPYAEKLEATGKSLFVVARTANRSAMELQDLLTGGRNVYDAKADIVNRYKNQKATKSGYDRIALVGPASSASFFTNCGKNTRISLFWSMAMIIPVPTPKYVPRPLINWATVRLFAVARRSQRPGRSQKMTAVIIWRMPKKQPNA